MSPCYVTCSMSYQLMVGELSAVVSPSCPLIRPHLQDFDQLIRDLCVKDVRGDLLGKRICPLH